MPDLIRFHGSYRYRSQTELERAVVDASDQLDEEDIVTLDGLRCFLKCGVVLAVDILLPATSDVRFVAANVFETLANHAIEGAVDADFGQRRLDTYAPELD